MQMEQCSFAMKSFVSRLPQARHVLLTCSPHPLCFAEGGGCRVQRVRGVGGGMGGRTGPKRRSLVPVEELGVREGRAADLLKPAAFTCFVGGCSFAGAAIWQYETMRRSIKHSLHPNQWGATIERNWSTFYQKAGLYRQKINHWWNTRTTGERVVTGLIGLNTAVFLLWRIPAARPAMLKYFTASPTSGAPSLSMLGSMFSHYSAFHMFCNMYVLWSFSSTAGQLFGKEQFLAMYLSAGMVSALMSHTMKILRKSKIPSVGASGAIMGVLGAVCLSYPDAKLSIAFIDQLIPHSFSAQTGMICLIALDVCGLLFRWRLFDHAAHLGGMMFGIWYVQYGNKLIWKRREPLMKKWHEWRGKP